VEEFLDTVMVRAEIAEEIDISENLI